MRKQPGLLRVVGNKFIAGLLILVPLVITAQALWWLFRFVDDFSKPVAVRLVGKEIHGIGFATTILIVFVTGLLFSVGPLRRLLDGLEEVIEHIPGVGAVYGTIKKVFESFADPRSRSSFKRFVLARLPGRTTPGFLTGTFDLVHADGTSRSMCTVYVPTNHLWVGDIVVLPPEDVLDTNLSIEDGISIILSIGSAVPARVGPSRLDAAGAINVEHAGSAARGDRPGEDQGC
jgi:uncharacterized membrane protein